MIINSEYEFLLTLFSPQINSTIAIIAPIIIGGIMYINRAHTLSKLLLFIILCGVTIGLNILTYEVEVGINVMGITWLDFFPLAVYIPYRIIARENTPLYTIYLGSFFTILVSDIIVASMLFDEDILSLLVGGIGGAGLMDGLFMHPLVNTAFIFLAQYLMKKNFLSQKIF